MADGELSYDIPTGVVTWRRTRDERLAARLRDEAIIPRSVTMLGETFELVPGVTHTREEIEAQAEAEFGPAVDPFVLGSGKR